MKKCPNCGALMKSNVNFCTKCGADLRQIDNSPQEAIAKSEDSHQIKGQSNSGENFEQNQAKPNAANNEQAQEKQAPLQLIRKKLIQKDQIMSFKITGNGALIHGSIHFQR